MDTPRSAEHVPELAADLLRPYFSSITTLNYTIYSGARCSYVKPTGRRSEPGKPSYAYVAEQMKRVQEELKRINSRMNRIKYKVAVLSVKGGVGKSFTVASLAAALAKLGRRVGVFDADIHGPTIPQMLGVRGKHVEASRDGLIPVEGPLGIKVMSIGLLLPSEDTPVAWRGPLKVAAIRQLLAETVWGDLDYLLIDLPPGTGDEQLSIMQMVPRITGALLVTTPSDVAVNVVKKAVIFTKKIGVPIIGIIENMSYFRCPDGSVHYIFGMGGGETLARLYGIVFLGSIPIDPKIREANDAGKVFFLEYPDAEASEVFISIASNILERIERT